MAFTQFVTFVLVIYLLLWTLTIVALVVILDMLPVEPNHSFLPILLIISWSVLVLMIPMMVFWFLRIIS